MEDFSKPLKTPWSLPSEEVMAEATRFVEECCKEQSREIVINNIKYIDMAAIKIKYIKKPY